MGFYDGLFFLVHPSEGVLTVALILDTVMPKESKIGITAEVNLNQLKSTSRVVARPLQVQVFLK